MSVLPWIYHVTFWACAVCVLWSQGSEWAWSTLGAGLLLLVVYRLSLKHLGSRLLDPQSRYVLITGCDTGFGHTLARELSDQGVYVIATCYDVNSEGTVDLRDLGRDNLHVLHLDVTSDLSVEECLQHVTKLCEAKGLWGLVNNAGINDVALIEFTTLAMFRAHLDVNFLGVVRMSKAFLPLIRKAKGRIVNVTSVHGRLPIVQYAAYEASKFACEVFSDVLRLEMTHFGVKVAIVEPGAFGAGTGIASAPSTVERRKSYFSRLELALSQELRATYGEDYCSKMAAGAETAGQSFVDRHRVDISPVIRAITHALFSQTPNIRYLVDGIKPRFIDIYCIMARMNHYLPRSLIDRLCSFWFPPPRPANA